MKRAFFVLILASGSTVLAASCGGSTPPPEPVLPFLELGGFEHKERKALPEAVAAWNGRRVRVTGFINPGRQARNLSRFFLVKDRESCCFGKAPQLNHYIDVAMKSGATADYGTEPVTVRGTFTVDERFDGDWPAGLFWMTDAELVK